MSRIIIPVFIVIVVLVLGAIAVTARTKRIEHQWNPTLIDAALRALEAKCSTSRGGRVFCSFERLGLEDDRAYVWAFCSEYAVKAGSLEAGSGFSAPAVIYFDGGLKAAQNARAIFPGDGDHYAPSIRELFPRRLHTRILNRKPGVDTLQQEVEANATRLFDLGH